MVAGKKANALKCEPNGGGGGGHSRNTSFMLEVLAALTFKKHIFERKTSDHLV